MTLPPLGLADTDTRVSFGAVRTSTVPTTAPTRAHHAEARGQQIMAFAQDALRLIQLEVLKCWLLGNDFEGIAAEVKLASADEAKKHLRAGLARLRRKLVENAPS